VIVFHRDDVISLRWLVLNILAASLFVFGCTTVNTFVVLLPEEGGGASAVTVGDNGRSTVLDKPYSTAAVDTRGGIETKTITAEEANRMFTDALAAQPPQPISFTLYFESNSIEVTP
jgi:hypothetical protein